jgi:hypothetical protein
MVHSLALMSMVIFLFFSKIVSNALPGSFSEIEPYRQLVFNTGFADVEVV